MAPDWVSVPEIVSVSSTSRIVPPLIVTVEPSVPASPNFMEPAVTAIPPDKVMPSAIETGVARWPTVKLVTVELASTSRPRLTAEVLTLATVIEFSRSLLSGVIQRKGICVAQCSASAHLQGVCSKVDCCS